MLDDFDNACQAYEKAIEMEEDHLFRLNYAITLANNDDAPRAAEHFAEFERLYEKLDDEAANGVPPAAPPEGDGAATEGAAAQGGSSRGSPPAADPG